MDSKDGPVAKTQNNYALNGKIMLCSVIVLFVALLLMFCFHSCARYCSRGSRRRRRSRPPLNQLTSFSTAIGGTASTQGLDISVIKSIPTFVYSAATHPQPLECSVCLSEFESGEGARILPKCNHTFHVECIDMWFQSHSNCPLCRAPVQLQPVVNPLNPTRTLQPLSSEPHRAAAEVNLVDILVEVPPGEEHRFCSGSPSENGSKPPDDPVQPQRRIWSI